MEVLGLVFRDQAWAVGALYSSPKTAAMGNIRNLPKMIPSLRRGSIMSMSMCPAPPYSGNPQSQDLGWSPFGMLSEGRWKARATT